MFKSGALLRGEWRDDVPHGLCILFSGNNELIEARFDKGAISDRNPVKLLLSDGTYYEGGYMNHRRHGAKGKCHYPNGDTYDGEWEQDKRISKYSKLRFKIKDESGRYTEQLYKGQFIDDRADGTGTIE